MNINTTVSGYTRNELIYANEVIIEVIREIAIQTTSKLVNEDNNLIVKKPKTVQELDDSVALLSVITDMVVKGALQNV